MRDCTENTASRIDWNNLGFSHADGQVVSVTGFPVTPTAQKAAARFLLMREPPCCAGCAPRDQAATINVELTETAALGAGPLHLFGQWRSDPAGYRLTQARLSQPAGWAGVTRRRALLAGPLICLPAGHAVAASTAGTTIDVHSHAGGIASTVRMRGGEAFAPVAEPMRKGGMAAVCLAVVSDGPTHKIMPDGRLHPFRDPEPGELYLYAQLAFGRVLAMARTQGLRIATRPSDLSGAEPAAVIAAEGADFLEGRLERVDQAYSTWSLRHLQLTHYRVNELGDIQTEPPVHGGLTDTGAEVIRRCNQLGIVVDVAHGTFDLVRRAVSVTTRPLVLSHTSLTAKPSRFTRLIPAEHARLVAQTGGVIGVWPPESIFPTLDALAAGMARMVDAVGIDHVALGSDMRGLVGRSVFPNYDTLPALAEARARAGFAPSDAAKILGGNYARVFASCVGPG